MSENVIFNQYNVIFSPSSSSSFVSGLYMDKICEQNLFFKFFLQKICFTIHRKLANEELNVLFSSPIIIKQVKSRRMRWAGHVARMEEERKMYKVCVGKPKGNRPLERPRSRWEDGL
jgi:hypothetical protein